jgi:hypothetical protein
MKTMKQLLIPLFLSLLPLIISNCKKEEDPDMTYFKDSLGCYPNLPSPELIYMGKEVNRYKLGIKNCAAYPYELFVTSPDLPPCGQNPKASRTWVTIHNSETDEYLYGFCGFNKSCDVSDQWFSVPQVMRFPLEYM